MNIIQRAGRLSDKLNIREKLEAHGVADVFRSIYYRNVLKSVHDYYENRKTDIDRICDSLADEDSVNTYKAVIAARYNLKRRKNLLVAKGDQYFTDEVNLKIKKNNITFVDCGAFDGDTIEMFLKNSNKNFNHIYAFEPDAENYKMLCEKYGEKKDKFTLIQSGVWSTDTNLSFCANGSSVSKCVDVNVDVDFALGGQMK